GQVPQGLALFLRVAQASEVQPGSIVLQLPAGPGLERLRTEPATLRALERVFSEELGRPVQIEPRGPGQNDPESGQRLTLERVKADQLNRLAAQEPSLRRAVEEWNLELME
ncbi:MAG: hypothetical protein ACREMA_11275, partial [Longimicrobiales bacterium]